MTSERKPRLCLMTKTENGYGFHLHGEKGKSGQFIRKVENGSPAEASGLRAGDRVVAVNGVNVQRETHHQVSGNYYNCFFGFVCFCNRASTGFTEGHTAPSCWRDESEVNKLLLTTTCRYESNVSALVAFNLTSEGRPTRRSTSE